LCDLVALKRAPCKIWPVLQREFLRGSFEGNLQMPRLRLVDADRIVAVTEEMVREIEKA